MRDFTEWNKLAGKGVAGCALIQPIPNTIFSILSLLILTMITSVIDRIIESIEKEHLLNSKYPLWLSLL